MALGHPQGSMRQGHNGYHSAPAKMATAGNSESGRCEQDVEKLESWCMAPGSVTRCSCHADGNGGPQEIKHRISTRPSDSIARYVRPQGFRAEAQTRACASVLTAASFPLALKWKQLRRPPTDSWDTQGVVCAHSRT